ncbi:hypothetical protein SAMN05443377_103139 [Propionibacterium cyclohexanicum]|uniref:Transposase n=1 Tax=Propionibacterium cyclohexanicum TaxID=64702 RepID=A0A1H9QKE3_9ACTN|nr:hypothetical protein SAMN05443377_103139 [Propionibacterium cyclohexanicum]
MTIRTAESYDLVAQTIGVWVKEYRKKYPKPGTENLTSTESKEIEQLRKELREARVEIEFLKKRQPSSRRSYSSRPHHDPGRRRRAPGPGGPGHGGQPQSCGGNPCGGALDAPLGGWLMAAAALAGDDSLVRSPVRRETSRSLMGVASLTI